MNIRILAGLGMFLLACGLMIIWYVGQRTASAPATAPVVAELPAVEAPPPTPTPIPLPILGEPAVGPADVDSFLAAYDARYRALHADLMRTEWEAATDPAAPPAELVVARRSLADYTGSRPVIDRLRRLRARDDVTSRQARRLATAWRLAAAWPATLPETAARTIVTERALRDTLAAHRALLRLPEDAPRPVTTAEALVQLAAGDDLETRVAAWEAGMSVGRRSEPLLADLRDLRNASARDLGYSSYFALQADDQGLASAEMLDLLERILETVLPLYGQLHCWARHELAARHGEPAPEQLPVHWLDDFHGARWPGLTDGPSQPDFADVQTAWIVDRATGFFLSLGLEPLLATFWEHSRFTGTDPPPRILHLDLDGDVRLLTNVAVDLDGFRRLHGQLGRVHHLRAASTPRVPPLLRTGPDRTFTGAVAALLELAAGQRPYLQQMGLLATDAVADTAAPPDIRRLLAEALTGPVVLIPFLCGTVAHWEYDLYETDLPLQRFNARWWELAARWQGIQPPAPRGEQHGDACAVPSVITTPARGYDTALSAVIAHQLHRYACGAILRQDVHAGNWFGNRAAGEYLHSLMALGATVSGRDLLRQATGEEISAAALVAYYAPLMEWLEIANTGREVGF